VKKKLPTVFVCPRCGEEAVRVSIDKATGKAVVACAICQLKDAFQAHPQAQAIDVYSYFTDRFYGVKNPRAIIPRDRPPSGPVETEGEETDEDVQEPVRLEQEVHGENPSETFEQQSEAVEKQDGKLEAGSSIEPGKSEASSATAEPSMTEAEKAQAKEEEENPFGDILESDSEKEKKRYRSPNPIEQESSSSSSQ